MLRAHLVGIPAACAVLLATTVAWAADEPSVVCGPVASAVTIDGNLDEWGGTPSLRIGAEHLVKADPQYAGETDLSAEVYVARSATTLYVAGRIFDDTLFWNPQVTWLGDGVELFLDFHPDGARREPKYDGYAHQLLLHPLASEVRWAFARFRGRKGSVEDPVDGLELAGLPLRDAKGSTIGYTFELALPFANFPAAPSEEGESFGFDVALSDSDGLPQQKNYATWSRKERLSEFPDRFGRIVLGPAPPPASRPEGRGISAIAPVGALLTILAGLLFLRLARLPHPGRLRLGRLAERLARIPTRPKLVASAVLLGLIAGAGLAADAVSGALTSHDITAKRQLAATVAEIAEEAGRVRLLEPQPPAHPDPLISLLGGDAVAPPTEYDYEVLPPKQEALHRTLDGTPLLKRSIPATAAWSSDFVVTPPLVAGAATLVYSWQPEPGNADTPQPGDKVAEVRFVHQDGTVQPVVPLLWGRHVDAESAPAGADHPGAPEAAVAYVEEATDVDEAVHADQLNVPFAESDAPSPVVRIEMAQHVGGGRFVLHGVTLDPAGAGDPVPLPLGRATRSGVPTWASPFPARHAGLLLHRGWPRAYLRCDVAADRLWMVTSLRGGYRPDRFRAPVLLVDLVFDDGSVDGPFRLENGVSIDSDRAPTRLRDEQFQAELAFEWGLPGSAREHFDVLPLTLDRPGRRLVEVQFEFRGEDEVVRVSSLTAGVKSPPRRPEAPRWLESSDEGYALAPAVLGDLTGVSFTGFRDGAAAATTLAGDARDRMLARRMSPDRARRTADEPEGLHSTSVLEGEKLHLLAMRVPGGRPGQIVELAWTSDVEARLGRVVRNVRIGLAGLLAPLLVLVGADLVRRITSLHARLVATLGAAAAIPVALGWFAVPELVGSRIEQRERDALTQKAAMVRTRLAALRPQARRYAEEALRNESLQEALRHRGSDEFRSATAAALRDIRREVAASSSSDARVSLEVFRLASDEEPIVFPEEARWTTFSDRTSTVTDELAYRSSGLAATGVAQQYDTAGDWRTTLVVELPVAGSSLEDAAEAAGGDVEVLVYSPRGYPLQSTVDVVGEDDPGEIVRKKSLLERVLAEQQPVTETRRLGGSLYTVSYDVLRGEAGVVSLMATAIPRGGAEDMMARLGVVSLLVFGAGVALQLLLTALVLWSVSRPFGRLVDRSSTVVADDPAPEDELELVEASFDVVEGDRDAYREELARLHDAVRELAAAVGPEDVVERSLAIVRRSVSPWSALLVGRFEQDHATVLGGFRGEEPVDARAIRIAPSGPLASVFGGEDEVHVASLRRDPPPLSDDEGDLLRGAERVDAYSLGPAEDVSGVLILLRRGDGTPAHDEFVAALARQIGAALENARLVRMAVHDRDTGAYVPSYFEARLHEEVDRAVAAKSTVSLLLVRVREPIDPEGRRRLRELTDRLREACPSRAFLGRPDPTSLAVALPESGRDAAEALAIEIRRAVRESAGEDAPVRVGLASVPEDAGSLEFLRAEARAQLDQDRASRVAEAAARGGEKERLVAEAMELGAVFRSDKGVQILETVERIAGSDIAILVEGETGVGKEVIADLIHSKSGRAEGPLVKINCAALPDALLESELFGYERGAFTGADRAKPGRFELASGGTIFLDEIGEMPLATQVKLLRVLQDHVVEHLGGTRPSPVDVRVIAATNRDLRAAIAAGRFREDLYYRLNAVTIAVPPLRARKEDIPALAETFTRAAAEAHGRKPPPVNPDAMDLLYRHDWPGNVRELRNVLEQAVVLSTGDPLGASDVRPALDRARRLAPPSIRHVEYATPAGGTSSPGGISDRQRRLLAALAERPWITNTDYCALVGVSTRTGLRDLRDLIKRGVIVMDGKRRGARYRLP